MDKDKFENRLIRNLEENMKKVFENIAKDIQTINLIRFLLSDKTRVCSLVPNRKDIHSEFDEHLDVKFLQVHSNGA